MDISEKKNDTLAWGCQQPSHLTSNVNENKRLEDTNFEQMNSVQEKMISTKFEITHKSWNHNSE